MNGSFIFENTLYCIHLTFGYNVNKPSLHCEAQMIKAKQIQHARRHNVGRYTIFYDLPIF